MDFDPRLVLTEIHNRRAHRQRIVLVVAAILFVVVAAAARWLA